MTIHNDTPLCLRLAERVQMAHNMISGGQIRRGLRRLAAYSALRQRHCIGRRERMKSV